MNKKLIVIILLWNCSLMLFAVSLNNPQTLANMIKTVNATNKQTIAATTFAEVNSDTEENEALITKKSKYLTKINIGSSGISAQNLEIYFLPDISLNYSNNLNDYNISTGISSVLKTVFSKTINPYINYYKEFDLGSKTISFINLYQDAQDFIAETSTKLSLYEYDCNLVNFILNIFLKEQNLKAKKENLATLNTEMKNKTLSIEELSQQNIDFINANIEINKLINDISEEKQKFQAAYGVKFNDNLIIQKPELNFSISEKGNYLVEQNRYALGLAIEAAKALTIETETLDFNAKVNIEITDDDVSPALTFEGKYKSNNLNLSAKSKLIYSNDEFKPTLTLSGSFSKNDEKTQNEIDDLISTNTNILIARLNYEKSLANYKLEAKQLLDEINTWKDELEGKDEEDLKIFYLKGKLLEFQTKEFEL